MPTNKKGFTLIELLVVIAIIGILAGVVLVSLSGARTSAKDARIISDMDQLRTAAELYYAKNNKYGGFCGDSDYKMIKEDIESQVSGGGEIICVAEGDKYCIAAPLNNEEWRCIDNRFTAKNYSNTPSCSSKTACE